jgi:transcriptional regulator with XRE-family HTH domain
MSTKKKSKSEVKKPPVTKVPSADAVAEIAVKSKPIVDLMTKQKLSIEELAVKAGLSMSGVFRIVRRGVMPQPVVRRKLATALGADYDKFNAALHAARGQAFDKSRTENPIKELREKLGISQTTLAMKSNKSKQTIVNWELGGSKPLIENLRSVAEVLEVEVFDLYTSWIAWYGKK